mgnify:CR=1 FL=1
MSPPIVTASRYMLYNSYIKMSEILNEYLPILIFIFIGFAIAVTMMVISFIVGSNNPDSEKLSAYECGFEAFDNARICLLYTSDAADE